MSDDGDKTCPLCAEEMDLTDQQLKPCKCGYEICVWCWHHIIEIAEKEGLEGRCPACRTPYDKERVVGMAANCGRVVAEVNIERKQKAQRGKPKASAYARRHLNGVRVIKRNLVYVVGLSSTLADENLLEHKEYFGQYGKVMKVSISRSPCTIASAQQACSNDTFSVYITYAKEDEAIRCIQAVHNFVLEGKPLRACFGTTKYCHLWLRNMTCTNPDCLYLHDVGTQEDSFTKDEMISAYTRSRVPQSVPNNSQWHSGYVLPPPVDDLCNSGTVASKNVIKSTSNISSFHFHMRNWSHTNILGQVKDPTNVSNSGRSIVLPADASWGSRVSDSRPSSANMTISQALNKQIIEVSSSSCSSSVVGSTKHTSSRSDDTVTFSRISERRQLDTNHRPDPSESINFDIGRVLQTSALDVSSVVPVNAACISKVSAWDDDDSTLKVPKGSHVNGRSRRVETLRYGFGNNSVMHVDDNTLDDSCRSAWDDDEVTTPPIIERKETVNVDRSNGSSEGMKPAIDRDTSVTVSHIPVKIDGSHSSGIVISSASSAVSLPKENRGITDPREDLSLVYTASTESSDRRSRSSVLNEVSNGETVYPNLENLCLGLASVNVGGHCRDDPSSMIQEQGSEANHPSDMHIMSRLQHYHHEEGTEFLGSASSDTTSVNIDTDGSGGVSCTLSNLEVHASVPTGSMRVDSVAVDHQRRQLTHSIDQSLGLQYECHTVSFSSQSSDILQSNDAGNIHFVSDVSRHEEMELSESAVPSVDNCDFLPITTSKEANNHGWFDDLSNISKISSVRTGENSIIANILSLDFDPLDESLSSTDNFFKLLGEIDKQDGSKLPSSWKLQQGNQSRFSFARQENQSSVSDASVRNSGNVQNLNSSSHNTYGGGFQYGYHNNNIDGFIHILGNNSPLSSGITSGVARGKVTRPPGFQVSNRAPPPGFSSRDRYGQLYETCPENRLAGNPLQTTYEVARDANDVEFIDPAILAVGRGILPLGQLGADSSLLGLQSAFPSQFNTDGDSKLHLLKQQFTHQNLLSEQVGDRYSPRSDAYISSRLLAQNNSRQSQFAPMPHQQPRTSHILGNQWDGWNNSLTSNDMGMSRFFRDERFGVNNYYPVNNDHIFHRAGSADIYNRSFGM